MLMLLVNPRGSYFHFARISSPQGHPSSAGIAKGR
jgi:hypothetical protein